MPFRLLNCLLFHEHLKPENLTNLKRIRIKKNCETRLNIDGYYKKEKKNHFWETQLSFSLSWNSDATSFKIQWYDN